MLCPCSPLCPPLADVRRDRTNEDGPQAIDTTRPDTRRKEGLQSVDIPPGASEGSTSADIPPRSSKGSTLATLE